MKKQLYIIVIVAILVSVGLSGCNSEQQTSGQIPEDLIIGKWHTIYNGTDLYFTFYTNQSLDVIAKGKSAWANYEITDENIIVTNRTDSRSTSIEYSFTNDNQKLILVQSGETTAMVLTRE